MRIAFIDDDANDRALIESIVENKEEITSYIYASVKEYRQDGKTVDALMLDIEMPDENGLDIARKLREADQQLPIVFLSWHQKYEHRSFLVHPFCFIDKHHFVEEMESCLNDLLKDHHRKNDVLILPNQERIFTKHVFYVERQGHYTHIHMNDITRSMKDCPLQNIIDQQIFGFHHINKSVIVNFYHVAQLCGKDEVVMRDGEHFEISRRKQTAIKEAYIRFKMR